MHLKWYNAETDKPLWIYSNRQDVDQIQCFAPTKISEKPKIELVTTYTNAKGERKVDGNRDAIKASQSYPPEFGMAVAKWLQSRKRIIEHDGQERVRALDVSGPCASRLGDDPWVDADLLSCFSWLRN